MTLGVVIVTYNAADVIVPCLDTLLASPQPMRVVLVDNASTDATRRVIDTWRTAGTVPMALPFAPSTPPSEKRRGSVEQILAPSNDGFAAGVNLGLKHLLADQTLDRFWILNPDTMIPPETPTAIATAPGGFALMGSRLVYADPPHRIQIDAGTVNKWTGVTGNLNLGANANVALPHPQKADFISGASMVASRAFVENAGLMPEEYFLYYEEVDWAQRRGPLPLHLCENAIVYHRAGSAIGSPTLDSAPSAFSVYYKHRARMMYLRRYHPWAFPTGYLYGLAKAAQFALTGHRPQAKALLNALHGRRRSADIAAQRSHEPLESRA
ncbi:MAG: glycosyltransferase family 2 protein [Pseudomonadota bacterium]